MFFSGPSFAAGFAAGFGSGILTREVLRASQVALRPVAKALIRGGLSAFDRTREAFAVAGEGIEDLVAEVRSDRQAAVIEGQAAEALEGSERKAERKGGRSKEARDTDKVAAQGPV
jgi:hypothetical protein